MKYFLRAFHGAFCILFRQDAKKVTFASYRSDSIQDNLAYVAKKIADRHPEYRQVFLFRKMESSLAGKLRYIFHLIASCYQLSTSKFFFIDDYYLPIYLIKPRKGMEIIQLWHSAGALKKFGHSTVGKPFGPSQDYLKHVAVHGNYTRAYVSAKEVIPYFAEAFNMSEENIYPYGIPRTDYFFDQQKTTELKTRFEAEFPEWKGKEIILYAPTFRGKSHYQEEFMFPIDLERMAEELPESRLLVHLHPYMRKGLQLEESDYVKVIDDAYTIQDLLIVADLLVTDYSTVYFDYSLLQKPVIFFAYDLEEYIQERDFYYTYEEVVPGPIVRDTKGLIERIKHRSEVDMEAFSRRFFDCRDGKSTERIVSHVFGESSNG